MKNRGKFRRNPVESADESPLNAAVNLRDRETMTLVRRAVETHNVMLAYQPVFQSTGLARPAFYEGLIRLMDDTVRIIPARDFIDAIEVTETGRIIDCLALDHGLKALATDNSLRLAINMSARSIAYPRWMQTLNRGLRPDPTLAERLILEITETSAMMVPEIVAVFMKSLQAKGISFALDDFGAGPTSFRHLRQFYFDFVKIDGQFIRGIAANADNQVLAQAMLDVARNFDMIAVAESVESAADAACLRAMGMDCMQGYFFGAPTITPPWRLPKMKKPA